MTKNLSELPAISLHQTVANLHEKVDAILLILKAQAQDPAPVRKANKKGEAKSAVLDILKDGTPRHVTEIHRFINDKVSFPISESATNQACLSLLSEDRLQRPRKGMYQATAADSAIHTTLEALHG